eukprot:3350705-Pyramimonas_sp.AAC.1
MLSEEPRGLSAGDARISDCAASRVPAATSESTQLKLICDARDRAETFAREQATGPSGVEVASADVRRYSREFLLRFQQQCRHSSRVLMHRCDASTLREACVLLG